jgi:UDP-glucuronate 4-epimerase
MKILITGCAGFIGFHLCKKILLNKKFKVYGIDNLNSYYDVKLKDDRLKLLKKNKNFVFKKLSIENTKSIKKYLNNNKFNYLIHLAAQAGVRNSIDNPEIYFQYNVLGFFNILNCLKNRNLKHFLFASTSSVYGDNKKFPLKEEFKTDSPLSFYAATKISNEVMGYAYSNIHKIPMTALRFFTVYGPYGRPDMALFKFTKLILMNKKIPLFNKGIHQRDFTYIDDVVNSIYAIITKPPKTKIPFRRINIARGSSEKLLKYVNFIEKYLNIRAKKKMLKLQKGDILKTSANINKLKKEINFQPKVSIKKGIFLFIDWFKDYYNFKKLS